MGKAQPDGVNLGDRAELLKGGLFLPYNQIVMCF